MLRASSIAFWVFFALTLPLLFAVALAVFALTAAFDRRRVVLHLWSCLWASFYVWTNPLWSARVTGRERLPWRGRAVLVVNHLSLLDILVVYGLFRPFKWVAKAEVFRVPILGWNMRLNDYVPVRRGDRDSVRRMMDHCRDHLARGAPVLVFPEGTRSRDGRLQPFKDGAFRLAVETGAVVIPVVITGTSDALPKHGLVLRSRMDACVEVLEPVDPRGFAGPDALRDAVHAAFAAALPEHHRPAAATPARPPEAAAAPAPGAAATPR